MWPRGAFGACRTTSRSNGSTSRPSSDTYEPTSGAEVLAAQEPQLHRRPAGAEVPLVEDDVGDLADVHVVLVDHLVIGERRLGVLDPMLDPAADPAAGPWWRPPGDEARDARLPGYDST